MLGVIIHEVGHNFFPMIVNSDERQWSWMDEGINTFVEYLTEELYDNKFPTRRRASLDDCGLHEIAKGSIRANNDQ
jgi:hypothetical protein